MAAVMAVTVSHIFKKFVKAGQQREQVVEDPRVQIITPSASARHRNKITNASGQAISSRNYIDAAPRIEVAIPSSQLNDTYIKSFCGVHYYI
jgi:hypothetical protein